MESVVYKRADGCAIALDAYPATVHERGRAAPVVVWIHGGALISGSRAGMRAPLRDALAQAGFAQVSIDYRLAPETKLPAILEDVRDAFLWLGGTGAARFGWDAHRVGVVGHSAGGYLALMAGVHARPRPRALVAFYGYGDIAAPWYSRPDPYYCAQPAVSAQEARAAVSTQPVSEGASERMRFYLYCRQHGYWPQEVVGLDPDRDARAFDPYCPARNVSVDFPPTLLLHGTADTDVPYAQSVEMAAALAAAGVTHELITIPEGSHGFDRGATPYDGSSAGNALGAAVRFLTAHVV
jgi:acetyl esterase/lipase